MSFTVQNVIDACQRDMMQTIGSSHPNSIDYVNRVQLDLLGDSSWYFRETGPAYFITRNGQSDYWVGATGSAPAGVVDTGLNITNFRTVKKNAVRDITNFRALEEVKIAPSDQFFRNNDSDSRPGVPRQYKNTPGLTPNSTLSIYPAADNQNGTQPQPESPLCSAVSGGALSARTYYVQTSYVDSLTGESLPSAEVVFHVPANYYLKVQAPQLFVTTNDTNVQYSGWWVYASTASGTETRQPSSGTDLVNPVSISSTWTQPAEIMTSGSVPVSTATIAPLGGYIIEFTYYPTRAQLSSVSDTLLVPDDYKDVVIAGTNLYVAQYLERRGDIAFWAAVYATGQKRMIRDKNYTPGGGDFMRPDPATTGWQTNYGSFNPGGGITVT